MSLQIVRQKIDGMERAGKVSAADIDALVLAAERSLKGKSDGVSNAEAREVADFFMRIQRNVTRKNAPTLLVAAEAITKLNAFFVAHLLPYGDNARPMMSLVLSVLEHVNAQPLNTKPRVGSLQPLALGASGVAYVDPVKREFVVRTPDGFYGPYVLTSTNPGRG